MSYMQGIFPIVKREQLTRAATSLWVHCPEMARAAQPGQFVHVRVPGFTLRRPISICRIDTDAGLLRIVFEARGAGTEQLAGCRVGDTVDMIGPLGNGFTLPAQPDADVLLIGGGIGVPPLLELAAQKSKHACALLGFRGKDALLLAGEFEALGCEARIATDDGTAGHHGLVTDLLTVRLAERRPALICACGPALMLRGIVTIAREQGIPTLVSLEERMGCGVGACLVCACRTVRDGQEIYTHVCKDGPVFPAEEVVL